MSSEWKKNNFLFFKKPPTQITTNLGNFEKLSVFIGRKFIGSSTQALPKF